MATVAHESGHMVTFLAMPERQWLYVNERAHEFGLSAERYVSLALSYFDGLPDSTRLTFLVANNPVPIPEDADDGRPGAAEAE